MTENQNETTKIEQEKRWKEIKLIKNLIADLKYSRNLMGRNHSSAAMFWKIHRMKNAQSVSKKIIKISSVSSNEIHVFTSYQSILHDFIEFHWYVYLVSDASDHILIQRQYFVVYDVANYVQLKLTRTDRR